MSQSLEILRIVKENSACHEEWRNSNKLDEEFMKDSLREEFLLPTSKESNVFKLIIDIYCLGHDKEEFVYVCGNSLGPQPKSFNDIIMAESETWAKQ